MKIDRLRQLGATLTQLIEFAPGDYLRRFVPDSPFASKEKKDADITEVGNAALQKSTPQKVTPRYSAEQLEKRKELKEKHTNQLADARARGASKEELGVLRKAHQYEREKLGPAERYEWRPAGHAHGYANMDAFLEADIKTDLNSVHKDYHEQRGKLVARHKSEVSAAIAGKKSEQALSELKQGHEKELGKFDSGYRARLKRGSGPFKGYMAELRTRRINVREEMARQLGAYTDRDPASGKKRFHLGGGRRELLKAHAAAAETVDKLRAESGLPGVVKVKRTLKGAGPEELAEYKKTATSLQGIVDSRVKQKLQHRYAASTWLKDRTKKSAFKTGRAANPNIRDKDLTSRVHQGAEPLFHSSVPLSGKPLDDAAANLGIDPERAAHLRGLYDRLRRPDQAGKRTMESQLLKRGGMFREKPPVAWKPEYRALKKLGGGLAIGAGVTAGAIVAKRLLKRRNHQEEQSPVQMAAKDDDQKRDDVPRDIAIGAIEGGAGVLATDRLIHRFDPKTTRGKLLIGAGVGGLATGTIGYGVNRLLGAFIKKKRAQRAQLSQQQMSSRLTQLVRFEASAKKRGMLPEQEEQSQFLTGRRWKESALPRRWEETQTKVRRGGRLLRDITTKATGRPLIDERGRARTPEWKKPWVGALAGGAVFAAAVGGVKAVNSPSWKRMVKTVVRGPHRAPGNWENFPSTGYRAGSPMRGIAKAHGFLRAVGRDIRTLRTHSRKTFKDALAGKDAEARVASQMVEKEKARKWIKNIGEGKEMSAKSRSIHFETVPYWDIEHRSRKTAIVRAPDSQKRNRRQKKWHERKANRDLIAGTGVASAGAIAWLLASRRKAGNNPPSPPSAAARVPAEARAIGSEIHIPGLAKGLEKKIWRASSAEQPIYFALPNRTLVARDRYAKQIHQQDVDRASHYYTRSALAGAGLGALLRRKMPLSNALVAGAGAGIGVQAVTRAATSTTKDQFGDRSWNAKRLDKAPSIAGGIAIGAIGAHRLFKKWKGFSSKSKVIQFKDKDRRSIEVATGAGTAGLVGGGLRRGSPLRVSEDIRGKRIVRSHNRFPGLQHEGIGTEDWDTVAEVYHVPGMAKQGVVRKVKLKDFAGGKKVSVIDSGVNVEAARRAEASVGKKVPYSLFRRNCQLFAEEMRTGGKRLLPRQLRTALITGGTTAAVGYGASKIVERHRRNNEFSAKDERPHWGRRAAIAGGLGAAGLGLTTLPGAVQLLKIQGRAMMRGTQGRLSNLRGLRSFVKPPKADPNLGGRMVDDYINASQRILNQGVRGKIAGATLQHTIAHPDGAIAKVLGNSPLSLNDDFKRSHWARFRSGPLQALGHWDMEHGLKLTERAKPSVNQATGRTKSGLKPHHLKRMQDEMHYGRERAHAAIKEAMHTRGMNEQEALHHVATKSSDPKIQGYFNELAWTKAGVAKNYAKAALVSPALAAGGVATTGAAIKKDKKK